MLRAGSHAHIALAGIVRDEQEPYFHFARLLFAFRAEVVNANWNSASRKSEIVTTALPAVASAGSALVVPRNNLVSSVSRGLLWELDGFKPSSDMLLEWARLSAASSVPSFLEITVPLCLTTPKLDLLKGLVSF